MREAFRGEPGNRLIVVNNLITLVWARRFEEAQAVQREALKLMPDNTELQFGGALLALRLRDSHREFEAWLAALPAAQRNSLYNIGHQFEWAMVSNDQSMAWN
jgi:hypothetical protein